jgi:hypothetical protein
MTTPPQFSPDGQWWWDGTRWVPAAQAPQAQAPAPWPQAAPPQQYPAYQPYPQPAPSGNDGKAIGSIILSVLWLCGVGSVVGVVLGHLSRSQARREAREPSGLAMAGLVLGYLGIGVTVAVFAAVLAFKDPLARTVKNDIELQSAADAQRAHHDATGQYAPSIEDLRQYGYDDVDGKVDVTVVSASATSFCMTTRNFSKDVYVSDERPEVSQHSCR